MEGKWGRFVENAKRAVTPYVVTGLSSIAVLYAASFENTPIRIQNPNGVMNVPLAARVLMHNETSHRICTCRATPLDPNNPNDINRFMSDASLQGGTVPRGGQRIEGGIGTRIGWTPC